MKNWSQKIIYTEMISKVLMSEHEKEENLIGINKRENKLKFC